LADKEKKIIMWIKNIISNSLNRIEQKNKLDLINELLLLNNSTEKSIELFEKVKANFAYEMDKRKKENENEILLINKINFKNNEQKKINL
jgi:hypothetical protein